MWGTFDRDVPALAKALADTGLTLTSVLAEPRTNFTLPGTDLTAYYDGLARGIENARLLGSPRIVVGSGIGFPGAKRAQNLERLVEIFTESVDYVQIADSPGRGEPGSGALDWPAVLATLRHSGYDGPIGLEYFPTIETMASLATIRSAAAAA
ncbi:TIM barrel protein [Actinoplanes sp. TRM 88003]|uniref:TIM barrel protein n=2 Tax=Paractinoplanes aksuensis TaxID=2939490 RepID=A0ABT1DZE2_9ACTN|nr:TIM barrel protein [Actinoplanes aksuensis]